MTYHFSGLDELLREAFARFAATVAARFRRRMDSATSYEEAKKAMVEIITEDVLSSEREIVLTHELYSLAARDQSYRDPTSAWMAQSQAALRRHFDPVTARILDALIEGLTIHRALDQQPRSVEDVRVAVERIAGHQPPDLGERGLP